MTTLLYIHGFNSSPQSSKAEATAAWIARERADIAFVCPFLSPFPQLAMQVLETEIGKLSGDVHLVGSSMGGFYATWLAEKYRCRAVLINPAVAPWRGADHLLGKQINYHTGERCHFEREHLEHLRAFEVSELSRPHDLWVLVQTGDEVLDYNQAVERYRDCRLTVEGGGDHGFQGYERFLPAMLDFFTAVPAASVIDTQ
ncbi:MAG: YqiA/YcfP family alpha/beta fold hydrolase [Porticoccaceae bacterium]